MTVFTKEEKVMISGSSANTAACLFCDLTGIKGRSSIEQKKCLVSNLRHQEPGTLPISLPVQLPVALSVALPVARS